MQNLTCLKYRPRHACEDAADEYERRAFAGEAIENDYSDDPAAADPRNRDLCRVLGIVLCRGLGEIGELHTIEIDDELEDYIRQNFALSEHGHKIKLYIGDAMVIIPGFEDESFDMAFIDADKKLYWDYFEAIVPKIRKGGFILADNTLWYGKVVEKVKSNDWSTKGVLNFNERLSSDHRVEKVILPVRDGLTLIRKKIEEYGLKQTTEGKSTYTERTQ